MFLHDIDFQYITKLEKEISNKNNNALFKTAIINYESQCLVRHLIHKCVICCRLRGKVGYQKMIHLPHERCTEAAPFAYCGVDMFVPLIITERRSELNSYSAIFTWFSSRTVTNSLHVDSFILALPRFMVRRGTGRTMEQILWVLGMN